MKKQIAKQFRRPEGFWGRIVAILMKKMNRPFYEKIIQQLNITDNDKILEIGYGHGEAIKLIGKMNKHCKISGIDFSELMVKQALKNNDALVQEGRLDLQYGDFLLYNFGVKKFTKVFCVNVIYFWADLTSNFTKVFEVLEPGGVYAIYMASAEDLMKIQFARTDVFNKYSIDHVKNCLEKVGFKNIKYNIVSEKKEHGYFIFAGK
jgi:ubiquinone/menaquinone biosynthesis C-methylase UbiE